MHYDIKAEPILASIGEQVEKYTRTLGNLGFVNGIDEIAVDTWDSLAFLNLMQSLVSEPGVAFTNAAHDVVRTDPFGTAYEVDYLFATGLNLYSDRHPYRIECMNITDGWSPLHTAARLEAEAMHAAAWMVHASFKCTDEADYGATTHRLREAGWECLQRCTSTYGRFSYWKPFDRDLDDSGNLCLKPRVNLRDAQ